MRIKKRLIFLSMFGLLFVSGSAAYFTDRTEIQNHIKTGKVKIALNIQKKEQDYFLPGEKVSAIPEIHNQGIDCYIRARIYFTDKDGTRNDCPAEYIQGLKTNQWKKIGTVYYYLPILAENDTTTLFQSFLIPDQWENDYAGQGVQLEVQVEAIQTKHLSVDFTSENPWGNAEIETNVKEEIN